MHNDSQLFYMGGIDIVDKLSQYKIQCTLYHMNDADIGWLLIPVKNVYKFNEVYRWFSSTVAQLPNHIFVQPWYAAPKSIVKYTF